MPVGSQTLSDCRRCQAGLLLLSVSDAGAVQTSTHWLKYDNCDAKNHA